MTDAEEIKHAQVNTRLRRATNNAKASSKARDEWKHRALTAEAERDALKVGAERYQLLAAYVVGPCTDADDQIIACKTVDQVSAVIDAMKAAS